MKKRIFKYPTGAIIPERATYLGTVKQTKIKNDEGIWVNCWLVWHYFAVEVEE
jgi:hypothetical protein